MGSRGALLLDNRQFSHIRAFPAVTVDTTGAGDAFNGALAASLAAGNSLVQAATWASAFASLAVELEGASICLNLNRQTHDSVPSELRKNNMKTINGIVPVMLTPFAADERIDYPALAKLIDWYLEKGVDALFAVCQSSEMQFLSLEERVELARFVVQRVNGRIPVIASGHISDDIEAQKAELLAMAQTGIDALVLVTNHLDPRNEGSDVFYAVLNTLLETLPASLPLGLYECPAPYRRLLTDDEFTWCANSGRFVVLKDVSCDLPTVERRVRLAQGTPLNVINANAAIAWPAILAGSQGFSGVFTNFHPELYSWLWREGKNQRALADELAIFLSLGAVSETLGYPKNAKIYHQRLGTFDSITCRVNKDDVLNKYWGLTVILDQIRAGTEQWRQRIVG